MTSRKAVRSAALKPSSVRIRSTSRRVGSPRPSRALATRRVESGALERGERLGGQEVDDELKRGVVKEQALARDGGKKPPAARRRSASRAGRLKATTKGIGDRPLDTPSARFPGD